MQTRRYSSGEYSASAARDRPGLAAQGCAGLIRTYQVFFRPLVAPACRYVPSCSEYARGAILAHGVLRGGWLAARRVARCNAWHPGGLDPVPGTEG